MANISVRDVVRIPEGRKAALIGPEGRTKRSIEEQTRTKLAVGDGVQVEGEDGLDVYTAVQIVKAIGRGFSPEQALLLTDEDAQLHVITLRQHSERKRRVMIARLVGSGGRAKKAIEQYTGCAMVVQGKTVALIGSSGQLREAAEAVDAILSGRSHGFVYHRLERAAKEKNPLSE